MNDLAVFIAQQLQKCNWSYRDAAEAIQLSASVISNIINETRKPELSSLEKISEGFHIPLWRVIEMAGYPLGFAADDQALTQRLASLVLAVPSLRDDLEVLLTASPDEFRDMVSWLKHQRTLKGIL